MSGVNEAAAREAIAERGSALARAGLTPGSSGNISVRLDDGILITPTNSRLGELDPGGISKVDSAGRHVSGRRPSKEAFLHLRMLERRPADAAVVHLHSTYAVAVSCSADVNRNNVLPPITAYYVMRAGAVPLVPYFRPGDERLADAVATFAADHHAMLLSNHGPVVSGADLNAAAAAIEELEETAKLHLILQGGRVRTLSDAEVQEIHKVFGG